MLSADQRFLAEPRKTRKKPRCRDSLAMENENKRARGRKEVRKRRVLGFGTSVP